MVGTQREPTPHKRKARGMPARKLDLKAAKSTSVSVMKVTMMPPRVYSATEMNPLSNR